LDSAFYAEHGLTFHNKIPQDPAKCRTLLTESRTITYLEHGSVTVRLRRPDGPRTEFTVFGSPYSPQYGTWAFMYPRADAGEPATAANEGNTSTKVTARPTAAALWSAIPATTDILITHTPPAMHCDSSLGCPQLGRALARVRPRLHVCGHVHQARGAERVMWDVDGANGGGVEEVPGILSREVWQDPNPDPTSAKISLVDLTGRKGSRPLAFQEEPVEMTVVAEEPPGMGAGSEQSGLDAAAASQVVEGVGPRSKETEATEMSVSESKSDDLLPRDASVASVPGCSESMMRRPDRLGRRETCVVNAAIMSTSWPHFGAGKQRNKPIVVDIDLPVWE
jgi:hypothetical protein